METEERQISLTEGLKLELEGSLPWHPLSTALLRYPARACISSFFMYCSSSKYYMLLQSFENYFASEQLIHRFLSVKSNSRRGPQREILKSDFLMYLHVLRSPELKKFSISGEIVFRFFNNVR